MPTDPTTTAVTESKPLQRWLGVTHAAGKRSRVAHYIVSVKPPGDGVGWHSACNRLWADGVQTRRYGWQFFNPVGLSRCRVCSRKPEVGDV